MLELETSDQLLFSEQAESYARFRPHYPENLYKKIFQHVSAFDLAWDVGTGNGQIAHKLSETFQNVHASDISAGQLKQAFQNPNIQYSVSSAESCELEDRSTDLITVGQAIHWFNTDLFYDEVRRVAKKNAFLAIWGYNLLKIDVATDDLIRFFHNKVLAKYWDPRRKAVLEELENLPFPFEEIELNPGSLLVEWTLEDLFGYLRSWSAVNTYLKINSQNPLEYIENDLKKSWGKQERKQIIIPLFSRMGFIN
ncbi:MAG: class I SAM-dependent methyltransferase [Flavobacteriales bacterium]|nr:class I SAM-dependent methyltransferase [Flavobacteriales bacterium]